jgi:hypothetical protein
MPPKGISTRSKLLASRPRPEGARAQHKPSVGLKVKATLRQACLPVKRGAMCVQRFDDSQNSHESHYLSRFAAFFIDVRAKRSFVESFFCFSAFNGRHNTKNRALILAHNKRRQSTGLLHELEVSRGQKAPPGMIPPQVHLRRPCYDFYFL